MSPEKSTGYPQGNGAAAAESTGPIRSGFRDGLRLAVDVPTAWNSVVGALGERMSSHTLRTYVLSARVLSHDAGEIRLGYATRFLVDWVRDHYVRVFEKELLAAANREVRVLLEVCEAQATALEAAVQDEPVRAEAPAPAPRRPAAPRPVVEPLGPGEPPAPRRGPSGLDTRHTFDTYVVGTSNQFAEAACRAVADEPGRTHNPLFIWGGSGLGKTHLTQAVGNHALQARPGLKVLYVTGEQFTNELIRSLGGKRMEDFRQRFRECDLLLVDDIQFIAGKKATEEEFFHTFNSLYQVGKQIVVTSDAAPHQIRELTERLRSRFAWGLAVDIAPPELETRIAILQKKAQEMSLPVEDDVLLFLATYVRQNVRELEGALRRVTAYANLLKTTLNVELCREVLRSVLVHQGEPVDCDRIIRLCAERFGVTVADIKGPVRKKQLARARHAAMYLARRHTKSSFPEIGERFGGKDHTTVLSACRRVPELMEAEPDFQRLVDALDAELSPRN